MNTEYELLVRRAHYCKEGAMEDLWDYVTRNPGTYEELIPMLTDALTNLEERDFAAYTLARIGRPAKPSIPNLVQALLYDPANYVSQPFLEALASIGCHTQEMEDALVTVLDEMSAGEVILIARLLLGVGVYREEVVQALHDIPSWHKDPEIHADSYCLCEQFEALKSANSKG